MVTLRFSNAKTIQQQKPNAWAKYFKKIVQCEIAIFSNWGRIQSAEVFFIIFPVSSSVCYEKIFIKKNGVTRLVFMINAIDGEKGGQVCCYATE